jgi:glycolate oxidase iron-sulfur subunit
MTLGLDDDELASCVSCGLCLPHCPTWRVTGEEARSPRGRISAMREVEHNAATIDPDFLESMNSCVMCRGCETACPSAVPFGRLMESTRETLARDEGTQRWWRRLGYRALDHPAAVRVGGTAVAVGQRLGVVPSERLGVPRLPLREAKLTPLPPRAGQDTVWLFTGCVMDVWQRSVHLAALRVVESLDVAVRLPVSGSCCGALSEHAGLRETADSSAVLAMASMPGDAPVLVDSAGCGAMMKDYGRLIGTPEAMHFSERVLDISEWLAERVDALPVGRRLPFQVAVQDPCHLRHVQRAHAPVRTLLGRYAELVELDDEGLCCGAGGTYASTHPELARDIRARKVDAIERTGAPVVASANPGCALYLAADGVDTRHPVELVADAIGVLGPAR